jgi:hypothetical protein
LQGFGIAVETVHDAGEVLVVADFQSTATLLQLLCLLEFVVLRTEDDGLSPYGSLHRVVDAHTKTATYVWHVGIAIDAGEKSEAVDD